MLAARNSLHRNCTKEIVFRARHVRGKSTQLSGQEMSIIQTHSLRLVIGDLLTAADDRSCLVASCYGMSCMTAEYVARTAQ